MQYSGLCRHVRRGNKGAHKGRHSCRLGHAKPECKGKSLWRRLDLVVPSGLGIIVGGVHKSWPRQTPEEGCDTESHLSSWHQGDHPIFGVEMHDMIGSRLTREQAQNQERDRKAKSHAWYHRLSELGDGKRTHSGAESVGGNVFYTLHEADGARSDQ